MLFVPLPLFATLFLTFWLGRFVTTRDMALRAHQMFAGLIALYAVQSLLASLRWGYGIEGAALFSILLAPILPVLAYLAYSALTGQGGLRLWPMGVVVLNWLAFVLAPDLSDVLILLTYIAFGGLLVRLCWKGADQLSLSPLNDGQGIVTAMGLTGGALIASGLTDLYIIYDFIRNDGRNAGLVLTLVQTGFVLAIGVSAMVGRATDQAAKDSAPDPASDGTEADGAIVARLEALFAQEGLHRDEDLSLRRLSRRLGVPDRQVSNAINRVRQVSVSQFVNGFRIKAACELLATSDISVLDASLASGFATKSNFNREFLRVTGMTPSRWRAEHRQEA